MTSSSSQPGLFGDDEIFTMVVVDEPVRRETSIKARELRPGDIVLKLNGDRDYAAFDVELREKDDVVRVWTATTDQAKGLPRSLDLTPSTPLTVARKASR
jgi:hypothetical protein